MKEGKISILGAIGTFQFEDQVITGVMLADVMASVYRLPADVTDIVIEMEGPGGQKSEGDKICTYLEELAAKGINITTKQVGPIGSVMTKIFLRGSKRIALDDGTKNWFIHNPWKTTQGDAAAHVATAEQLLVAEEELVADYVSRTKLDAESVKPLMSNQTSFSGQDAVAFGFATEVSEALNIAAYIMANEKTMGQRLDELIALIKGGKPAESPVLALSLQLSDGDLVAIPDAATEADILNKTVFTADDNGNPTSVSPIDGEHGLRDGRRLVIKDKKVVEIIPAKVIDPALQVYEMKIQELETLVKNHLSAGVLTKKEFEEGILALRAEIKTGHKPPVHAGKGFNGGKNADDALAWDKSMADGTNLQIRRENPEMWTKLYVGKFGVEPATV